VRSEQLDRHVWTSVPQASLKRPPTSQHNAGWKLLLSTARALPAAGWPQGVPCVQAAGEGEAMCAALNLCGWAHACHSLDVDVLLFGALTVYKQMHLQVRAPCSACWSSSIYCVM
jgi:hypothetical protein